MILHSQVTSINLVQCNLVHDELGCSLKQDGDTAKQYLAPLVLLSYHIPLVGCIGET